MSRLQLPIYHPPIYGLLRWAYTLCITAQQSSANEWLYSNFIQVHCNKHFIELEEELFFDFYHGHWNEMLHNPFLVTTSISTSMLQDYANYAGITNILVSQLDSGNYPVLFVDEQYISYTTAYQAYPFPHHIFIYGYDLDERIFYTYGFGHDLKLGHHRTSFLEVEQAFQSIVHILDQKLRIDQHSFFYDHKPAATYELDLYRIQHQLQDYLNSHSDLGRGDFKTEGLAFGIECYDHLVHFLRAVEQGESFLLRANPPRQLHLLWEHKKTMMERVAYLQRLEIIPANQQLLSSFIQIANQAQAARDMYVEHVFKGVDNVHQRIIEQLFALRDQESVYVEMLIKEIEHAKHNMLYI
ncbi:hypothetical protein [Paenibacillus taiwanensis]|uniref:hypothetical protein n=1 Tax=Paenibacillus taiwanensis TaxID=401638 RepID=UPI000490B4C0|nr:hypothetical protein [Paenibacillus taiwanensis]